MGLQAPSPRNILSTGGVSEMPHALSSWLGKSFVLGMCALDGPQLLSEPQLPHLRVEAWSLPSTRILLVSV